MYRAFLILTLATLTSCNTAAPVGDALPVSLDGKWRIDLINAPSFACVDVSANALETFDFGCKGVNLLSRSGEILYDEHGPYFSVVSDEQGQINFWLTRIKGGYVVIVERAAELDYGVMIEDTQ